MMLKNVSPLISGSLLLVSLMMTTGCATSVQQKKAAPPKIDRISEEELARLVPKPLEALTLDEIVRLSSEGQSPEQIIEKIKATDSLYELTPGQNVALSQQGVDIKVLDYIHASRELAWRNSLADEIGKREKEKRIEVDKLKRQLSHQRRFYDPFCTGYYGLSPYGYGAYGSRFGSHFGIGAGYAWPWRCW